MKPEERARKIEFILSDVDGVLTNGEIIYNNEGIEAKRFHARDGFGIKLWNRAGFRFGILTARVSHIVKVRAAELDIDPVRQGFEDKLPTAKEMIAEIGLQPDQVCYIGDDLPDLPVMRHVGLGVAVADGAVDVRAGADLVTKAEGGAGAVREVIEFVMRAKNRWTDLLRKYAKD